jgi:hypothetical protein
MNTRIKWISVVVASALVSAFAGIWLHTHYTAAVSEPVCTNTATEMCPSDYFAAEYRKLKRLQTIAVDRQLHGTLEEYNEKQDQLNGLASRLAGMQPQGFQWDEKKWKFVKLPTPSPAPATVANPVPTGK